MKCAEVMEWMHRYLDHDLNQDEIAQMFRHIDNCPSCAEIFERLSLLSKELEQLPDVKPPFSLVDSILPQLAELDRSSREQSADRAEEPVVVPFSRDSSRRKPSKGTSIASRTGIGAVAAAVILGIAIFNMPDKMPGAEVDHLLQDTATMVSGDTANEMSLESKAGTTTGSDTAMPADSGTDLGDSENHAADLAATPYVGDDNATDNGTPEQEADPASMDSAPVNEPDAASGGRAITEPPESAKPKPTEKTTSPKQSAGTKAQPSASNGAGNNRSKVDKKDQSAGIDTGNAANSAPSSEMDESLNAPYNFGREVMSLNLYEDPNVQTWTSPDGQYAAEVADLQLVIYKNPPKDSVEDRLAVVSYPLEGNWISGEWSADSLQFMYVIEKDGVNVTNVYTIGEEAMPSSAPASTSAVTPAPSPTPANTPSASSTN